MTNDRAVVLPHNFHPNEAFMNDIARVVLNALVQRARSITLPARNTAVIQKEVLPTKVAVQVSTQYDIMIDRTLLRIDIGMEDGPDPR